MIIEMEDKDLKLMAKMIPYFTQSADESLIDVLEKFITKVNNNGDSKICPLMKMNCKKERCMFWISNSDKKCAIPDLAFSLGYWVFDLFKVS